MAAVAHHRPTLEVVPEPGAAEDDWTAAETLVEQYNPEHQLIGSMMWLSPPAVQWLLDLVPDTAIWNPRARRAIELIRHLTAEGRTATPPTVLAADKRNPSADAIGTSSGPNADQHHKLALYLFDAYSQAIAPHAAAATYARDVLDEAYRRAFEASGTRMQDLATSGLDRHELTARFAEIRDELIDLWRRAEAAGKTDAIQP